MRFVLAAWAAVCCGAPLTSSSLWDWRVVSSPQLRPDGKYAVYTLTTADRMKDVFHTSLWLASTDGRDHRPVTQGPFKDSSPRWSPDGGRLAYVSNRSGKAQIHVRWMEGGQDTAITDLQEAPQSPVWSPDGKWIAYTAHVPGKPEWDVKMPAKPASAAWAAPPVIATRLHWRRDGSGVVKPGYTHVFVVPASGGAPRQITTGDFDHTGEPAWTPDGQWILVSADRTGNADYSLDGPDIWAFHARNNEARRLTNRKGPDNNPLPSPGGRLIAYTGFDSRNQSHNTTHLYVMDADGGNPRCVTQSLDRDVTQAQWSFDGKTLYFTADTAGGSKLYRTALDGKVEEVTKGGERFGSYGPAERFSMAAGRVAVVRSTPGEPADLVTFMAERPGAVTRLTQSNEGLLAAHETGAVEEIVYKSFDGRSIQGWIIKPPGFDPAKKYPLILDIHGGPHAMYGVEFAHQMQIFAARGFVVLYTNPRGSTGYGEEFGNVIHGNYPGDDYKDLMAGVDFVLAKGYVDPKRLTVTGGSGGGLLTAWIVGHTERFAAAVSQYPVTNWITQAGTADIGLRMTQWMKGMPWEKPEQYLRVSPISYAANFKTPTMVITGEEDWRTPIAESEELYFALKMRKVDTVLVRVPGEPHGIRGAHPSHRIAKIEHILAWMEKYTR